MPRLADGFIFFSVGFMESTANRPGPASRPASGDAQLSRLEEQLFTLAQGPGARTSDRPEASLPRQMAVAGRSLISGSGRRRVAMVLLAAGVGVSIWWWMSGARTAPAEPALPAVGSGAAAALEPDAIEQLRSVARELVALRQMIDQLKADQERAMSANETLAWQVKQNQEQLATTSTSVAELSRTRDQAARGLNELAEQFRSIQAQISRESELTSERLKANEDQIRRTIALRAAPPPRVVPPAAPQQPASSVPPKPAPASAPKNASPPPKKPQLSSATRPAPAR